MIGSFGVRHHQYADDTQMYIAASEDDLKVNIDTLEKCTTTVHQWLLHNSVQLNPSKSKDDLKVNIDTLKKCTTAVHQWLLHNSLQLNPSKS